MFYLTYAEPPGGVYESQVTDVIRYLNANCNADAKLIAFISIRGFSENKKKIKKQLPDAIVLPMIPKATWWRFNSFILALLCIIKQPKTILARNVIAANMALKIKSWGLIKKMGFDGRGAISAEWNEYDVQVDPSWKNEIDALEKNAVINADARLAVSNQLVTWWKNHYGYTKGDHVVIPCTLNSDFTTFDLKPETESVIRKQLGYSESDLIIVYSGSTAGWQSFSIVKPFLQYYLRKESKYKALFLSKDEPSIRELEKEFPGQVKRVWLNHKEVPKILAGCDLGILIREQSVSNQVASPTKFAEYLSAGVPVAISENLGDYSDFVKNHHCGIVVKNGEFPQIEKVTFPTRKRLNQLVMETCTKNACQSNYKDLLQLLKP